MGQSIEDVSKRTPQSKTFQNPDGSMTAQVSALPLHFRRGDGAWEEIDNTLIRDADGTVRNRANSFVARFGAAEVRLETQDGTITMAPMGSTGTADPVVDAAAGTVTYPNVWSGVDLRYRVENSGVKEELVVRSLPSSSEFAFRVRGTSLTPQSDGGLTAGGAFAGKWRVAPPIVLGKDGRPLATAAPRFRVAGEVVTLAVSNSWLASLGTADFPVIIDPSWSGGGYSRGYLGNASGYETCDPCQVRVGKPAGESRTWRSTVAFPYEQAGITGAQLDSARVLLQTIDEGTSDPYDISVFGGDVNGSYGGDWNWTNLGQPLGFASAGTLFDFNAPALTTYYRDRLNSGVGSMPIKFVGNEAAASYKRFVWFQLFLNYNARPNVPDTLSQSWSSGFTAPELSARFTDNDGDNGNVDFEVTGPNWFYVFQPVWTTNGGTARFTPTTATTPGTYSWRVRAWDGRTLSSNPEWSGYQNFTIIANVAPNVPDNLAPDNNAASASAPTLYAQYTANDGQGGWIEFDLGSEDQVILVPAAHNQTVSFPPGELMDGNYSWRVRATDGTYESAWTPWRYFSVRKNLVWYENFTGNNGALWNSTRWSTGTNSPTRTVDIQSNEGRLYANGSSAGATARQAGSNINLADIDVGFTFRFENTNSRSFLRVRTRDAATNAYRVELRNDSTTIKLQNILNGVSGLITQFTYNPDGQSGFDPGNHRLRVQVTGSTVRVKAWPATSTEPDTWQIDRTDTSVTGPGTLKIDHNYDTGSRSIYVDDVAITNLQVQGGTTEELPASAMHAAYPNHGYAIMARNADGGTLLGFTSDRCKPVENDLIAQVKATTEGNQPEFRGAWPSGLVMHRGSDCDGRVGDGVHITLDYMTNDEWFASGTRDEHGENGGHVHSFVAPPEWCDVHGHPKVNNKCGLEYSRIHIKESKFNTKYPSDTYRRNFLIHETGHAFGFRDYCGKKAITNDGSCGIPEGWTPIDRRAMRDRIYPNFPYS